MLLLQEQGGGGGDDNDLDLNSGHLSGRFFSKATHNKYIYRVVQE